MPGLPRKYAKMGFARGWKAFRASKRTRSRTRTISARRSSNKVARRRRSVRSVARRVGRRVKSSPLTPAVGAFAYGLGRGLTLSRLDPLLNRLPIRGARFADEAVMFGLSYLLAKGKIPFLNRVKITRSIGKAGMLVEAFRVGEQLSPVALQGVQNATGIQF